jgi:transcriptional antiterminator RfaH
MNWYAVNTKPRQESLADLNLRRLSVETFCPLLKRERGMRQKRQIVIEPLFPGYLFARFDMDTHFRAVNYAMGVRSLVSFGSNPVVVEDAVVESIQSRLQDGCIFVKPVSFMPGEIVRIEGGPFQGLEAIFEREMNGQQRAVLLLKALSFQARVVVDFEYVVSLSS